MELGELIAELRLDKGLSQKKLGKIINKSDSWYNSIAPIKQKQIMYIPFYSCLLRPAESSAYILSRLK